MTKKNVIVVAGPTASGKTACAVSLARRFGCEIISADSRQVYRLMDIGTGKDIAEYGDIPYHCIDIADPSEVFNLHRYLKSANSALEDIFKRGRGAIICGGTGLYIEALLKGYQLSNIPEDPLFRDEKMALTRESLLKELQEIDPETLSKVDCSSKKRIVRALEIARAGGTIEQSIEPNIDAKILLLMPQREVQNSRIEDRFYRRLDEGMIEEVEKLIAGGVGRDRLELLGLEYRYIGRMLFGDISREEMEEQLLMHIKRFAKRQRTWFRGMERRGFEIELCAESSEEILSYDRFSDLL